jgi:lipid-binding SYLF domain-containing protein
MNSLNGFVTSIMKGVTMEKKRLWIDGLLCLVIVLTGCSTTPEKTESKAVLSAEVEEAVAEFKAQDPTIQTFFDNSYGYAVLPKVTKGAFWFGVAGGRGQVFRQGQMIGFCKMGQATIGFSFGGEFFREIIFFRQPQDLARFTAGEFAFSAQVTGTAITAGAAAKVDYKDGMAVFVLADRGLMVDASLGGQKFAYAANEMP